MSMVEFEKNMRDIEEIIERLADHSKDETVRGFIKCLRKCGPNTHLIKELFKHREGCEPDEDELIGETIARLLHHIRNRVISIT